MKLPPIWQLGQRVAHQRGLRLTLGRNPLCTLASLVNDAPNGINGQGDAGEVSEGGLFQARAGDSVENPDAAPLRNGHVSEYGDGEQHQGVGDLSRRRGGPSKPSENLRELAQRYPPNNPSIAQKFHFFMNRKAGQRLHMFS